MDTTAVVWTAVAVVVVLLLLAGVALLLRHRATRDREQRLAHAEALRGEAASHVPDVRSAAERARDADAEAGRARARAEEAERVAADAHRVLAHEQAAQEDVVRRADTLDPRVDTRADDYRPITGPDMKGAPPADDVATEGATQDLSADGRHRAG